MFFFQIYFLHRSQKQQKQTDVQERHTDAAPLQENQELLEAVAQISSASTLKIQGQISSNVQI